MDARSVAADYDLQEVERGHIRSVREMTVWHVLWRNGAAEVLGVQLSTLESHLARLGIHRRAAERTK